MRKKFNNQNNKIINKNKIMIVEVLDRLMLVQEVLEINKYNNID
jgi:hypothetical protein